MPKQKPRSEEDEDFDDDDFEIAFTQARTLMNVLLPLQDEAAKVSK